MGNDPLIEAYAEALFQVARAEAAMDRVEEELTHLKKTLDAKMELREFLGNPQISPPGKKDALRRIFGETLSPMTLHWLDMVVDQERQRRLPAILEAFFKRTQEAREKVTAEVITSVPLTEDLTRRLEAELSKVTKKQVFLKPLTDDSILGGVIVRLGDKVIDGSVRARLEEIKREMIKT